MTTITISGNVTNEPIVLPRSDLNHGAKRVQAQIARRSGVTAASVQLRGRLNPDLPWVLIGSAITAADSLTEIPPYPEFAVTVTGFTGTGIIVVSLNLP
jgi:hypothetical protein